MKTIALDRFSVTVKDGEFVTFLGTSGCGKTTSLRLVAGFIRGERGSIRIGERIISDEDKNIFIPPDERGVGMVFQSYAVWPHMNVFNVVMRAGLIQQIGTAREIYEQPANQFVADFIGTANFLEVNADEKGVYLAGGPPFRLLWKNLLRKNEED
ncbi:MAG: hypothetical protein DRP87_16095 [Spirochaetes bacterium]|nr:MAG: hypothetical protein DRP87_16095 [Spirochaetota bacterium]